MPAALTTYKGYYDQNNTEYKVAFALASAGGPTSHADFISHLFTPHLKAKTIVYHDTRCAQLGVLLLPPLLQVAILPLLVGQDLKDADFYDNTSQIEEVIRYIPSPGSMLRLIEKVNLHPYGTVFYQMLESSLDPLGYLELLKYCGLTRYIPDYSLRIEQQVEALFEVAEYTSPYRSTFLQLIRTNEVQQAAYLLTSALGYPENVSRELQNIAVAWSYQT